MTFSDGTTKLGTAPVTDGKATFRLPGTLAVGTHPISASFVSSSTFAGGDSATTSPVTFTVVKAKSSTKMTYTSGKATVTVPPPVVR